jgi:FlaA1/EpsC-like NDP-sugar epimerase
MKKENLIRLRDRQLLFYSFYFGNMALCLTGKTALVTGATGTLGKEVIKGLAQAGCFIIATDQVPVYSVDSLFDELNLV